MIKGLNIGFANILFLETTNGETKERTRELIIYDKEIFLDINHIVRWLKDNIANKTKERLLKGRIVVHLQDSHYNDYIWLADQENGSELSDTIIIETIFT